MGHGSDSEESLLWAEAQASEKANIHLAIRCLWHILNHLCLCSRALQFIPYKNIGAVDSIIKIAPHEKVLAFLSLAKLFSIQFFNASCELTSFL